MWQMTGDNVIVTAAVQGRPANPERPATMDVIPIKPHHFVDIIRAFGEGRLAFDPHPYGHNVHGVSRKLLADRDAVLQMELGADEVCRPCIHNVRGACDDVIDTSFRPQAPRSKQEWNLLIDLRWCDALGLADGDRITARQFCERLRQQMDRMADIYREVLPERVAVRAGQLDRGLDRYLVRLRNVPRRHGRLY